MLIRDKLLEIIDLLENENTYFFGFRLLEDFGDEYDLGEYNMTILYFYNSVELVIDSNQPSLRFRFNNKTIRILKFNTKHGSYKTYIIKDLTELKDEIKNRIK
jgi:hypothetical protein